MSTTKQKYQVTTSDHSASLFQFWPLDLAMLLFSVLILVLVLRYLDFEDPRLVYNAWTYLIGIPSIMVVFSMLLRVLVNRVVEKSMQLSFLASVVIHLILLITALNVVIFARYWPDVFEAVTIERTPRQITVPEYFKPSLAGNKQKPEYLRPVQTEHEATPTETNKAVRPNESELKPTEFPTHEKLTQPTVQPFTIPKPEATPAPPSIAQTAQAIQRQPTPLQEPEAQKLDVPDVQIDSPQATSIEASQAADESARRTAASSPIASPSTPSFERPTVDVQPNTEIPKKSELSLPAPEIAASARELPRQAVTPNRSLEAQRIAVPRVDAAESSQESAMQARDVDSRPAVAATSPSLTIPRANIERTSPAPSATTALPPQLRSSIGPQNIEITSSDPKQPLARNSVGGVASMPAPSSAKIVAPTAADSDQTAEQSTEPSLALDRMMLDRNSAVARQSAPSSITSTAAGPESSIPRPRPSFNESGTSQLGRASSTVGDEGPAIRDAAAKGSGQAPKLSRSNLSGIESNSGAIASNGQIAIETDEGAEQGGSTQTSGDSLGVGDAVEQMASRAGDLEGPSRAGNRSSTLGGQLELSGLSRTGNGSKTGSSNVSAASPLENAMSGIEAAEIGSSIKPSSGPSRSTAGSSTDGLAVKAIDVPMTSSGDEGNGDDGQATGEIDPSERGEAMRRSNMDKAGALRPSFALDSNAEPSLADLLGEPARGLDPTPRDVRLPEIKQGDLQTQRFLRSEVGGPTIAGAGVPVPAPAFSRRLDRNRERSAEESLGPLGPETEEAIERGLEFLAKHQRDDGSWHLEDFDTEVQIRSDAAATALAVLAFQGAGYTHRQFEYAPVVAKALQYLVDHQKPNGDLYIPMNPVSDQNAWLYTHSIAALALSEAYGMTQDETLQEPAQRAVDFIVASQDKNLGGWRYRPGTGTDTSVTGWFMMALKSADLAGLKVPREAFLGIQKWVENSQASGQEPHLYRYNWMAPDTENQRHGRIPTPVMTSVGLLMRLHLGWQRDNPNMIRGAKYLLEYPPAMGTPEAPIRDTYYWYYSSQVLFHMGGDYWRAWNQKLHPLLIQSQVRDGEMAGSWEPLGDVPDAWGKFGGRLYVTTLNLLSLEVYYRHLPLYDATAK